MMTKSAALFVTLISVFIASTSNATEEHIPKMPSSIDPNIPQVHYVVGLMELASLPLEAKTKEIAELLGRTKEHSSLPDIAKALTGSEPKRIIVPYTTAPSVSNEPTIVEHWGTETHEQDTGYSIAVKGLNNDPQHKIVRTSWKVTIKEQQGEPIILDRPMTHMAEGDVKITVAMKNSRYYAFIVAIQSFTKN